MRDSLSALRASLIPSARLSGLNPSVAAAVRHMRGRGASIEQLSAVAAAHGGVEGASAWLYGLRALERSGLVQYTVVSHAGPIARLTPISPHYSAEFTPVPASVRLALSRFALTRRAEQGPGWILESPLALSRIELLHPRSMTWLHALGAPVTLATLARDAPSRERAVQHAFVALLCGAGFLTTHRQRDAASEDRAPHLATWEFADALVHARSRRGRHDHAYGEVFPFRGRFRPLPLTKPPMSPDVTPLARPSLTALARSDLPFSRVLESRRSVRAHGRRPIDVRQLAEFLYRAARVQRTVEPKPRRRSHRVSLRPSPGGGACHELELYVAANRCAGLARGLYHYNPLRHALERLDTRPEQLQTLFDGCPAPENAPAEWHILIIIAARFQRVSWKYRGLSYATVLKDVGALMQTMYLVATAMHLAPCALGGGDSERFARAIGSDFFEETSVGEFVMGTRAKQRTSQSAAATL